MEKIKQMLEIAELAYRAHERLHELEKTYDVTVYFQFDCQEKITENLKMIAKYGDDKLLDDPVWDIYSFKDLSEEEK